MNDDFPRPRRPGLLVCQTAGRRASLHGAGGGLWTERENDMSENNEKIAREWLEDAYRTMLYARIKLDYAAVRFIAAGQEARGKELRVQSDKLMQQARHVCAKGE